MMVQHHHRNHRNHSKGNDIGADFTVSEFLNDSDRSVKRNGIGATSVSKSDYPVWDNKQCL